MDIEFDLPNVVLCTKESRSTVRTTVDASAVATCLISDNTRVFNPPSALETIALGHAFLELERCAKAMTIALEILETIPPMSDPSYTECMAVAHGSAERVLKECGVK